MHMNLCPQSSIDPDHSIAHVHTSGIEMPSEMPLEIAFSAFVIPGT